MSAVATANHTDTALLGDVCTVLAGNAWKSKQFNKDGKGLPIIRIQNVTNGDSTDFAYWDHEYDDKYIIQEGDLLLTLSGSFRTCIWAGPRSLLNQRVVKLEPGENLDHNWFLRLLRTLLLRIEHMGRHALVNNVSITDLKAIKIPLPPLSEQKRIAGILDKADAIRRKRQQAIGLTEQFLRSTFLDMFGDPKTHTSRWDSISVGDAVTLTNGRAFKSSEWGKEGLPILRIQNLKSAKADYNCFAGTYDEKHLVQAGDLLIAWAGQLVSFGVHIWSGPTGLLNQHIFNVSPKTEFEIPFLHQALTEVIERAKSTFHGIDMKHITKADLTRHEIANPPIELQREFTKRTTRFHSAKQHYASAMRLDDNLFNSLVQRAFRGEL